MSNDKETQDLAGCALALLMVVPSYLIWGFVTMKLWAWEVMPAFHVAPLTLIQCIGLSIFIGRFRDGNEDIKEEYKEPVLKRFVFSMINPWFLLGTAWILEAFK